MRLEININHTCNAACRWCNRAIDKIFISNMDMTLAQLDKACDVIDEEGAVFEHVIIAGGEPTMHPDMEEMVRLVDRRIHAPGDNRVSTNGMIKIKPPLPDGWRYYEVGLRNDNPRSGKRGHWPWFISPHDFGFEASHEKCKMWRRCGIGLDACGFSMCSAASTFGRLLKINPYFDKPSEEETPQDMCKHCINGLTRRERRKLHEIAPPIDQRYKTAISEYREKPIHFKRAFE